ncbi:hypothetical protein DN069_15995 [Streptacidiphilus pinicola]|uniref:Uncharacterized protein n=1 Tax=Streptacidiphilus pinicola TaxID=2219663 RepID=A0A2X0J361_9ACTN|nr:hypothetical protein [Streptacidiphilus pinicola]RAG84666.1 hypothetical protein DN069_15995 [Streptacidiphilus pinicola]
MTAEPSAELLDRALVEEAARKSGLLWVRRDGGRDRALWHAWVDDAVVLVGDGGEQPLEGLAEGQDVVVTLRSRDKWGRLVAFRARTELLAPRSEAWQAAVDELKGKRLNALDHDGVEERWAQDSRVLRLAPQGHSVEHPGAMPDGAHTAPPVPTAATTRRPIPAALPKLLLGRKRRRQA